MLNSDSQFLELFTEIRDALRSIENELSDISEQLKASTPVASAVRSETLRQRLEDEGAGGAASDVAANQANQIRVIVDALRGFPFGGCGAANAVIKPKPRALKKG